MKFPPGGSLNLGAFRAVRRFAGVLAGWGCVAAASVGVAQTDLTKERKEQWGEGIPFETEWRDALRDVADSGKMLLVYNGWPHDV
ncbi:MAG: hypothetical protein HKN82_08795 [Akkermansiaceae bacterium]|nr:hypothetical protein [Akkermansiaceae bacterium]